MAEVSVVGGGVVGLTTALELARAGHDVWCVRDRPVGSTVSAVAGGLWFPYHVEPRGRVLAWGDVSRRRFTELARDPASGVALREGLLVERGPADRWWTDGLAGLRDARTDELPDGATSGVVVELPLVDMELFLPWLERQCRAAGVEFEEDRVDDLDELDDDLVVVAAGAASATLTGEEPGTTSRGQVALLENPGLRRWLVDDAHPDGLLYVLPHPDRVVCGGTDVEGSATTPDPQVHEAILARARAAVPELAGARVIRSAVGLRPLARQVSVQVLDLGGRKVVTNHGHGGAGVTLSWGCAAEVARLVDELAG